MSVAAIFDLSVFLKFSPMSSFIASLKTHRTRVSSQNTRKLKILHSIYKPSWGLVQRETPQPKKFWSISRSLNGLKPRTKVQGSSRSKLLRSLSSKISDVGGGHLGFERHFETFTNVIFHSVPQNLKYQSFKSKHQKLKFYIATYINRVGVWYIGRRPNPKKIDQYLAAFVAWKHIPYFRALAVVVAEVIKLKNFSFWWRPFCIWAPFWNFYQCHLSQHPLKPLEPEFHVKTLKIEDFTLWHM